MNSLSGSSAPPSPDADPYARFHRLSPAFRAAYFAWHRAGQYEGVAEFESVEAVGERPPPRERDDWYAAELDAVERWWVDLGRARVLEIGCGDGNLTAKLAGRAGRLVSRDIDAGAVALTAQRLAELGLGDKASVEVGDATTGDPSESGAYDVVFFVQVLEHVPGWEQAALFDRVLSLVAPGGCLFVSTPNRWALRDAHDTGRLFVHWLPRRLRVPLARRLGWGLPGHDPSWPYPPVLHDYVSFAWMRRRARRAWPGARSSAMTFYPTVEEWASARATGSPGAPRSARALAVLGRVVPPNLYFGEKVVFARPEGSGSTFSR